MGEEITRILKLLEDGKINSEEAERLINAVSGKKQQGFFVPAPPKIPKELFTKMETIPEQVGKAVSAAFGSVGTSGGRRTFHNIDRMEVKIVSGNLKLTPASGEVEFDGTGWPLRTLVDKDCLTIDAINGDIELKIKENSSATLNLVSADLSAEEIDGSIIVETVSGDADIARCSGEWNIRTVSGDAQISESEGRFAVSTKSGDISFGISGDGCYSLKTFSGDIDVSVPSGKSVAISVERGEGEVEIDPELQSSLGARQEASDIIIEISNKSGDINISQK